MLPPVRQGEWVMLTAADCRKNAEQCIRWARHAETADRRKAFFDMAVTWSNAAAQLEARFDPIQLPNEGARTDTSH
jgi:hypothetical protein